MPGNIASQCDVKRKNQNCMKIKQRETLREKRKQKVNEQTSQCAVKITISSATPAIKHVKNFCGSRAGKRLVRAGAPLGWVSITVNLAHADLFSQAQSKLKRVAQYEAKHEVNAQR